MQSFNFRDANAEQFERNARIGEFVLKSVNQSGYSQDGFSFWDIFGTPGQGSTFSNARQDVQQLRGWNAAGVIANSLQAVMATVNVFCSAEEAERLKDSTGEESVTASRVTGIEQYRVPDDWVQAPINHRVSKLLSAPNPWEDEAIMKCKISQQIETHGVAYLLVLPNQHGEPSQLHVIPKAGIQPETPSVQFPEGSYRTNQLSRLSHGWQPNADSTPDTLQEMLSWLSDKTFSAKYIIPIGIPSLLYADDFFNPTGSMADFLDTDQEMHRSIRQTMRNNTTNGPLIEQIPGTIVDPETLRQVEESLQAQYSGPENAGKPMRVPQGVKLTDRSYNSREMEYSSSVQQMRDNLLALRGVPPSFFGVGGTAGYAGVVGEVKAYAFFRSQPLQRIVAGQITLGLKRFFSGEAKQFIVVFQSAQLDDPQAKQGEMQTHISAQAITKGEYRKMCNLPPFGDERDDEIVGAPPGGGGMPEMPGMPGMGGPDQPGIGAAIGEVEQGDSEPKFHSLRRSEFSNTRKGVEETIEEYANGRVRRSVAAFLLQQFSMSPERADQILDEVDQAKQPEAQQPTSQPTVTEQLQQSLSTADVAKSYFDSMFSKMGTDSDERTAVNRKREPERQRSTRQRQGIRSQSGRADTETRSEPERTAGTGRIAKHTGGNPITLGSTELSRALEFERPARRRAMRVPAAPQQTRDELRPVFTREATRSPETFSKSAAIASIMGKTFMAAEPAPDDDPYGLMEVPSNRISRFL